MKEKSFLVPKLKLCGYNNEFYFKVFNNNWNLQLFIYGRFIIFQSYDNLNTLKIKYEETFLKRKKKVLNDDIVIQFDTS